MIIATGLLSLLQRRIRWTSSDEDESHDRVTILAFAFRYWGKTIKKFSATRHTVMIFPDEVPLQHNHMFSRLCYLDGLFYLPRTGREVVLDTVLCWKRRHLKPQAVLKTYELFVYGDMDYITTTFSKKCTKRRVQWRPSVTTELMKHVSA